MSYWNAPKSLQHLSCAGLAIRCVSSFSIFAERKIKLFNSELICEEETASLLRDRLLQLDRWFTTIPGIRGKLGSVLESSLENATELQPEFQWKLDYVLYLLLKVFLLESVFIDRDYPNNCGLCSIPSDYETLICTVLKGHTFKMKRLYIYGAIYPSILETIILQAKGVKHLAISQINLTDNLMHCIRVCSELEELYLLHSYIWMAVSSSALCKGFFHDFSEEIVAEKYDKEEDIALSFPKLKNIEIGSCTNKFITPFCKWLLYFYDITESIPNWKSLASEEDRSTITEKLILPVIRKGKILLLKILYVNSSFLNTLTTENMDLFLNFMPNIDHIFIDSQVDSNLRRKEKLLGKKLRILASKFTKVSRLTINISSEDESTRHIVLPCLIDFGTCLTSLTLTSEYQGQNISISNLLEILNYCPNIVSLKLLFLNCFSITYEDEPRLTNLKIPETKLKEFWLHEVCPWDVKPNQSQEIYAKNWEKLLNRVLHSSPFLQLLSITICQTLFQFLCKLQSTVSCFHLHVKDGCEWSISHSILINTVKRFPNLKHFYIEELDGETFWLVKNYFKTTKLNVYWGNLGGWPRT